MNGLILRRKESRPTLNMKQKLNSVLISIADSREITQFLRRLLGSKSGDVDKAEAEERIFSSASRRSGNAGRARVTVYPEEAIRRYLDEAKENIDVIDFRSRQSRERPVRRARLDSRSDDLKDDDLAFSDGSNESSDRGRGRRGSSGSASEQVPVKLAFPGNEFDHSGSRSSGK